MKIQTKRFGELQVNKEDILSFEEGILGFDQLKRFFIVDPGDNTLIMWLQSIDDENTAFPIIEPKIFKPDYAVKLLPPELASLKLENISEALVFSILTIPQDITEMNANLKAPVVINKATKAARQIVLQDNKLNVSFPMYKELKKYIVGYSSDDSKRTNVTLSESATTTTPEEAPTSTDPKQPEAE